MRESGNGGMTYIQNLTPDEVIQGIFSIKKLVLFTKCTNLCQNIKGVSSWSKVNPSKIRTPTNGIPIF